MSVRAGPTGETNKGTEMDELDRNPWQGLNRAQVIDLDSALLRPERRRMDRAQAYEDIHREYAMRCATLLVNNDLRGALNAAEIASAALGMVERTRFEAARAAERLAQIEQEGQADPRGQLVYVPGQKKRKRMMPDTADQHEAQPRQT